jgi:hypothetical protein
MNDQPQLFATLDAATVRAALLCLREQLGNLELNPLAESIAHKQRLARIAAQELVDETLRELGLTEQ